MIRSFPLPIRFNHGNVSITKINHPPVTTMDSWYKPFPVIGGLWLCYTHITVFSNETAHATSDVFCSVSAMGPWP